MKKRIGAILFAFDRPQYLSQVIQSLELNQDRDNIDWYFMQDGTVSQQNQIMSNPEEVDQCTKILQNTKLNPVDVFRNQFNQNMAYQWHEAFELYQEYDLLFFFEDDMKVSSNYLRLLKIMAYQYPDKIGSLYCEPWVTKKGRLAQIQKIGTSHLWGFYMWKEIYDKIRPDYERYWNYMKDLEYRHAYAKNIDYFKNVLRLRGGTQDVAFDTYRVQQKIDRIVPYISRGYYLGETGMNWNKEYYSSIGMNKQNHKIDYASDANLEGFSLR